MYEIRGCYPVCRELAAASSNRGGGEATVIRDRQTVWLDQPNSGPTWTLPTAPVTCGQTRQVGAPPRFSRLSMSSLTSP
jgi:hypothetical protein